MFRAYSFIFIFCAVLMFALYAQKQTHAQSIEDAMAMPEPEPIELVVLPSAAGPINCYKIKEGFLRGKWVTQHRICQYQHDKTRAYVEAHWTCYIYNKDGGCMTWKKWSTGWYHTIYTIRSSGVPRRLYSSWCKSDVSDPCEY